MCPVRGRSLGAVVVFVVLVAVWNCGGACGLDQRGAEPQGVVEINSTTVHLFWSGGPECTQPPCSNGTVYHRDYACSAPELGAGNWDGGIKQFMDPIPAGNRLLSVTMTFIGRFFCDVEGPKATFIVTIDDMLAIASRFPTDPAGCNCTACMGTAQFHSEPPYTDFSEYKYHQINQLQISLVVNEICLSSISLELFYEPVVIQATKLDPDQGPITGGTPIVITGSGWGNDSSVWCKFGDGVVVAADYTDETSVNCTTPPVNAPSTVPVLLSVNGQDYFDVGLQFSYLNTGPNISGLTFLQLLEHYWWVLAIGILVIIGVVSVFALTFKSKKRYNDGSLDPLLGTVKILNYGSDDGTDSSIGMGDIIVGERIGRGNFGEVFKGQWHGTTVAIKKTKLPSVATQEEMTEFLQDFEREAHIMRSLRHPNVLQFLGICKVGASEICIITEFMPQGSLHRILHSKQIPLSWERRLKMAVDVSRGMNYLHLSNPVIIHRDLKSHNLLVDEHWKVKVCDFGLAKLLNSTQSTGSMTSCGTPAWTAPEVLRNEYYTTSADVFSFGIVLWELVTREEPHHGVPPFQVVFSVGTQGIRPTIPSSCPADLARLIEECWAEKSSDRPSFVEVIKHLEAIHEL